MTVTRHQAVGAYRRWSPTAFDAVPEDTAPAPEPELAPATAPVPEAAQPGEPEDPPVKLPTAQEIESMLDEARDAGRAAGYEEGAARAREEAKRLAELVAALDGALTRIDQDIAEELVTLAIEVARQMVRHTLADHPSAVTDTVREALQQLPQNQVRIHINPDDAALIREYLADQLEHGHHRLIEDDAIARGGCRLEAAGSEVDASIETRWRRILQGLGRKESGWED